jgi:hypothetical protein
MQSNFFLYEEPDTLVVELAYCTMHFDLFDIQRKAYQIFGDDYEDAVIKVDNTSIIAFTYLHDEAKHDILNDLIYYYGERPTHIIINSENNTKTIYK